MKKAVLVVTCLITFLVGWFASDILQSEKAIAARTIEYKVVDAKGEVMTGGEGLEKLLNTYAKQGWKLLPYGPAGYLIFER